MGIKGLNKVILDHSPRAIKENSTRFYSGRRVAVDASMAMYQFLIAVRTEGNALTTRAGEATSHLMGFFYRTIRLLENGIRPIYVFDGAPPSMKQGELDKRGDRRKEAGKNLFRAHEIGDLVDIEKYNKRTVRVTTDHVEECKKLLELMGIPVVQAPGEAEAQCAQIVKYGLAYGVATEDMDTLTFASPVLLRRLTASETKKASISEIRLDRVLEGLGMSMEQFVDLCILLGCDYCETIRGIGPNRAVKLIRKHGSIEVILDSIDLTKHTVPDGWKYQEARSLFLHPESLSKRDLEAAIIWKSPQEEDLVRWMVDSKGFSEERVRAGVKRLVKSLATPVQNPLSSFFSREPKDGLF